MQMYRTVNSPYLKPCTHGQVFLDKINLHVCTTKIDKSSLTSHFAQKLA